MSWTFNPFTSKLDATRSDSEIISVLTTVDTEAVILALTPTAGLIAYGTDTQFFYVADGTNWRRASLKQILTSSTDNEIVGTLKLEKAAGSDVLIIADASSNKKFSIKHGTNTVTQDFYSPEPDNKMLNSGFETDLSSWTSVLAYTLNDQFTTDRAAGAVNGTSAEPTGGTRTVTDTNSKLSISGSQLSFATGGSTAGNPGLWYGSVSRSTGKVLLSAVNRTSGNDTIFGFDANQSYPLSGHGFDLSGTTLFSYGQSTTALGTLLAATNYTTAIVLRSTGAYYYVKGGVYTNWTLIWIDSAGSTATLYPSIYAHSTDIVLTADNLRIPTSTWLPTEGVVYDNFTR